MKRALVALVLVLLTEGCQTIPDAALIQLKNASAIVEADLREWETISPEQQKRLHLKVGRACATAVNAIDGSPISPVFASVAGVGS